MAVQGERAFVLYHIFPPGERANGQLAELLVTDGKLSCVREFGRMKLEASKEPGSEAAAPLNSDYPSSER